MSIIERTNGEGQIVQIEGKYMCNLCGLQVSELYEVPAHVAEYPGHFFSAFYTKVGEEI